MEKTTLDVDCYRTRNTDIQIPKPLLHGKAGFEDIHDHKYFDCFSVNLFMLSYIDEHDFITFDDELDHDPVADADGYRRQAA